MKPDNSKQKTKRLSDKQCSDLKKMKETLSMLSMLIESYEENKASEKDTSILLIAKVAGWKDCEYHIIGKYDDISDHLENIIRKSEPFSHVIKSALLNSLTPDDAIGLFNYFKEILDVAPEVYGKYFNSILYFAENCPEEEINAGYKISCSPVVMYTFLNNCITQWARNANLEFKFSLEPK
jgi:hypothetical protein